MKKIMGFLYVFFFLLTVHTDALATSRVFLLDTSGSMKKEGLFNKIKDTLKRDYVSNMKPGEHVIILAFDEKVSIFVDQKIMDENDISKVNDQIDGLRAVGPWTWMTKGLELTIEQARRLKKELPSEDLTIYFLTDGVNDPPPNVQEPRLKFIEVLLNYFKEFRMDNANVYVLLYKENGGDQAIPDEDKKRVARETDGTVTIGTKSPDEANPLPSEVRIGYTGCDLGKVNLSRGNPEKTITLGIRELKGDARGKNIQLSVTSDSPDEDSSIRISPSDITIKDAGQTEKITIHIPKDLPAGDHKPFIRLISADTMLISPNRIPVTFTVKKGAFRSQGTPFNWEWFWKPLAVFLLLAGLYALFLLLRQRSLWVQKDGEEESHQIRVRNMKKSPLEPVGLPNCTVGFGVTPPEVVSVFLFQNGERQEKILVGKPVICKGPDDRDVVVTFHDKPVSPQSPSDEPYMIADKNQSNPDFFKKRNDDVIDFGSDDYKGDIS